MGQNNVDLITYSIRCALYDEYCKEMSKYDPKMNESRTDYVARSCSYYLDEKYIWLDIVIAGKTIGFIIIGDKTKGHDVYPQFDYFIEQTYILPDYRRHGFVFSALKRFVDKHKGKYGLIVLHKNFRAQDYWKSTFSKLGGYQIAVDFSNVMLFGNEYLWGFEVK